MGIYSKLAGKLSRDKNSEEEKSPESGKRKGAANYRTAPFSIPDDATREDLVRVLEGLVKQKVITQKTAGDSLNATRNNLATMLEDLVRRGVVAREEVEFYMEGIIAETREKIKTAAEVGRLLDDAEKEKLLITVKARFEEHNKDPKFKKARKGIEWAKVQDKLEAKPEKMWSLNEMERTGGEPDVVWYDKKTNEYIFVDCSKDSPRGRRNICFNRVGQERAEREWAEGKRIEMRGWSTPRGNAVEMAEKMGIKILRLNEYLKLQKFSKKLSYFDFGTKSWILPDNWSDDDIKNESYALEGDRSDEGEVYVNWSSASNHGDCTAFRGSLRV